MKKKFYFIILPTLVLCLGAGSLKSTAIQQGLKAMFGDDGKFLRIDVTEVTAPDTPKENKGVIYAKADHKLYYKDENGAESDLTQGVGSGDNVSVNGVGVVDPDFVTTGGQITFTDTSNTVTADITDDTVLEADLKAVNASADEDILTKENTTGDFEWHTPSELGIPSSIENLSFFASTTSAQLAGVISNETGTGVLVYGTTPTFTTSIDVTGGGEIDAGGMNIDASNSFSIANTDVIADSTGTATLSNIDALDATTETTVEAAIDSLPNVTTAAALSTVGVIGSGTWQGTAVDGTYVDLEGTELKSTGEAGGTKFLREDGDNSCSWQTITATGALDSGSITSNFTSIDVGAGAVAGGSFDASEGSITNVNDIACDSITADDGTTIDINDLVIMNDFELQRATIRDYGETTNTVAAAGATETLDLTVANVHDITLDEACTLTFSNPPASGTAGSFTLILRQDGTGGYATTFPASADWAAATAPTLSTGANDVDILVFITVDGGTIWHGMVGSADSS